MSETHHDQIARVKLMAGGDDKWDLSPNNQEALKLVLEERALLHMACLLMAAEFCSAACPSWQHGVVCEQVQSTLRKVEL